MAPDYDWVLRGIQRASGGHRVNVLSITDDFSLSEGDLVAVVADSRKDRRAAERSKIKALAAMTLRRLRFPDRIRTRIIRLLGKNETQRRQCAKIQRMIANDLLTFCAFATCHLCVA